MDNLPNFLATFTALLTASCFIKVLTTLSIFRLGLGLRGVGFGLVVFLFSLSISWFTMQPHITNLGGLSELVHAKVFPEQKIQEEITPFLKKNVDEDIVSRLQLGASRQEGAIEYSQLLVAFLVSELRDAFYLGFLFIIPFFVIDIAVANALTILGMLNIETFAVSFPLKILLFFSIDGWGILTERLLLTYGT